MSSPYRGATPPDDDAEPMPLFRPKTHDAAYLIGKTAITLALAYVCKRLGDEAGATRLLVYWLPALAVCLIILVLERPVRAWRQRRRARIVARGVAELEAKVTPTGDSG